MSLPVFPAQDSPMHRYYAHALGAVLAHDPQYAVYAVRHPFPPYATQYISLLALFHFFSYDWAEKIFTCLEIVCFASGVRLCAIAVGPAGAWVSLLVVPLLLPWYLLMGFFNYSIGLGLALLAVGFWLRIERSRGAFAGFAVCGVLLIFSHPVPVLLLLCFSAADLLRRRWLIRQGGSTRRHLAAAGLMVLMAIYPSLAIDKTTSASTLSDVVFHVSFVRTVALLTGLSPYNTRSHGLLVNGYRLCVYVLLIGSFIWGLRVFRGSLQRRELSTGGAFFLYALLFAAALPILPDRLNGGVFFATRMVILLWIFFLLAASESVPSARFRMGCVALGSIFSVLTLLPAEHILRPISQSVRRAEAETVPSRGDALILSGPMLPTHMRNDADLAFDPFLWASILPLVRENDIVLNAPWLDLSISPLRASPNSPVLPDVRSLINMPPYDPPPPLAAILPPGQAERLIRRSQAILYAGTDSELRRGLLDFMPEQEAAQFHCKLGESWSLLCFRTTSAD